MSKYEGGGVVAYVNGVLLRRLYNDENGRTCWWEEPIPYASHEEALREASYEHPNALITTVYLPRTADAPTVLTSETVLHIDLTQPGAALPKE